MIITAIAAMDRRGLIGSGMKMPWHLPNDLKRFRKETLGKPVIMGRRTFETLRGPLDRRANIVLTNNPAFKPEGCLVARSIDDALKIAKNHAEQLGCKEAMIIGGGVVFVETVPLWDRLLLTVVEGEFQGDTHFPVQRVLERRWRLLSQKFCQADAKNIDTHRFLTLERQKAEAPLSEDFDFGDWLTGRAGPIASSSLTRC